MKLKNAVIGTKVKVKSGNYKGLTGMIVDGCGYNDWLLVQFAKSTDLYTHNGNNCSTSGKSFDNVYYFEHTDLKRIKE